MRRQGFDFEGYFKRLSPTKFLVRPRRSSIRFTWTRCHNCSVTVPSLVGVQIQKANAIIRGFCNHYRADQYRVFQRLDVLDTAGVL